MKNPNQAIMVGVLLLAALAAGVGDTASAALIVSAKTDTPYDVSPTVNCDAARNDDLVNLGSTVVSSWAITPDGFGGSNTAVYDGSLSGWSGSDAANPYSFAVTFNTAVNIGEIRLFTGWPTTIRMNQDVTITYKDLGDETIHTLGHKSAAAASNTRLETIWTDSESVTLLANVTYLEIAFAKVPTQGSVIQEIDVLGVVPEPVTLMLLGLGSLGMLLQRRR
jgi:hypothetical protein